MNALDFCDLSNTQMSDWHRAVARVTTAQLCRAAGLDRSSRDALDCLNDVLIRHLLFVATTAAQAAELRGRSVSFEDAVLVLTECQVVGARLPDEDAQDLEEFIEWLRGPANQRALQTARMQRFQINTLGLGAPASAGAPIAGIPPPNIPGLLGPPPSGVAPILPPSMPSQLRSQPRPTSDGAQQVALSQQGQQQLIPPHPSQNPSQQPIQQPQQQQVTQGATLAGSVPVAPQASAGSALENTPMGLSDLSRQLQRDDWVKSLVKQQILMGHEKRFWATEFGPAAQSDCNIEGGPSSIEEFYAQEVK